SARDKIPLIDAHVGNEHGEMNHARRRGAVFVNGFAGEQGSFDDFEFEVVQIPIDHLELRSATYFVCRRVAGPIGSRWYVRGRKRSVRCDLDADCAVIWARPYKRERRIEPDAPDQN